LNLHLNFSSTNKKSSINITGSKSETNRLLLLQALFPELKLENISVSDDSIVMQKAILGNQNVVDIHHAGTAMRFLTAYFAIKENSDVFLTGSSRMKQRPIKFLVDALQQLGAEINYVENENYPPIRIKGKKLTKREVTLKANVSSQYISALLLIAPKLENGLELVLEGEITSIPYIRMTLALLNEIGIETSFENNIIKVNSKFKIQNPKVKIESDWSSASYYYSIVALSQIGTQIILSNFKKNSFQGDSILVEIYKSFGVETTFVENQIIIEKKEYKCSSVKLNLIESPDIAQTIAVTCFGLGVGCRLEGLHTLKIKEADRLEALKKELSKLGAMVFTTDSILQIAPSTRIKENISIKTYQDHRMAMAFAPLALRTNLIIEESEVVSKSYPTFWDDLKQVGFQIEEFNA
jgi:3-phosphoshikimate 1-carboxyvinyltransferase